MADNSELIASSIRNEETLRLRGLSTAIPKPNIVRIEVLDGLSRMRYLGTLQRQGDNLKRRVYDNIILGDDDIFFGFVKAGSKQNFGFTSPWENREGSGGLLGGIKSAVLGNRGSKAFDSVKQSVRDLSGVNATATGSSTLKKYSGTDLKDFNVECSWYLPEQFNLCVKSLKVLSRMAYPRQLPDKDLHNLVDYAFNKMAEKVSGRTSDPTTNGQNPAQGEGGSSNFVIDLFRNVTQGAISGLQAFNDFFGRNLSFDPLPVRVSVGQYIDVEPLVIDSVTIDLSKETYVNGKGRHVPLTCSVNISLKFWMRPAPKLEFFQLLGEEMFGQESKTKTVSPTIENTVTERIGEESTSVVINRPRVDNSRITTQQPKASQTPPTLADRFNEQEKKLYN